MKKIRILRLNEWHPGAKDIDESIVSFMERGEYVLNIPREDLLDAVRLLIIYYEGGSIKNMFSRESDLYRAMVHMELCVDTIIDDGYPIEWILKELKRLV